MSDLVSYLFETNAVEVCPENKPFFLTSGMISPYFVNTQYVYGGKEDASELLSYIDSLLSDRMNLPKKVFDKVISQYESNKIFNDVINIMIEAIKASVNVDEIDYISGGERRDWYFSNIIAYLLKKPHVTIFKDHETLVSNYDFSTTDKLTDLSGKKLLHVTDLVTSASSFSRFWIPAVRDLGGEMVATCYIVDRKQGGTELLEGEGVKAISLTNIDINTFKKAFDLGIINAASLELVEKFIEDPYTSMRNFLLAHPEFIEESLKATDPKTPGRIRNLLDNDLYNLKG